MFELRILGEIQLSSADGTDGDVLLRQPKRMALLAYLAMPAPGTWHRRDTLLALFWPDLDTAHARTSLRNSLYVIRQALGDDVVRNRGDEEISLDPARVRTDLSRLWDALEQRDAEAALGYYAGELLRGLYPAGSEGFLRWLDLERTRLRIAVSTAAMACVDHHEQDGKLAAALAVTRRVSDIQPDDETVVRRMMTLQESIGDRAGALTTFETYRGRLAQDFDAEPAAETLEIVARLRATTVPVGATSKRVVRTEAGAEAEALSADSVVHNATMSTPVIAPKHWTRSFAPLLAAILVIGTLAGAVGWKMTRAPSLPLIGASNPLTADDGMQVEAAISPNGRLVAYAKGNLNHLKIFVQRIGGGNAWQLSADSADVELMPRWSPDNDEVLFLARNNAYAAPSIGGAVRLVARGTADDGMVRSASWSPTGDSIAIVRNDSLLIQGMDMRTARYIGSATQIHSCVWSPDNRWIACISGNWIAFTPGPLFGNDAPTSIVLFPVAGGSPVQLTDNTFENESPVWSTDGRFLWIVSNRDGPSGEVFAIPIGVDGKASSAVKRVGLKAGSISLSSGRIAYSVPSRKANIWRVPIPTENPATVADAVPITTGNQVIEVVSASADGNWLLYDSNLHGNPDIFRLPIGGGESERLTTDTRHEFAPDLSPDNREVAWQRFVNGERRVIVKRIDSDVEEEIQTMPGDQGVPRWSPNGSSLVAWSHIKESGAVSVVKRDANGKWQRPAWRLEMGQLPVWSPNGKSIAFVLLDGSVQIISADSGALHQAYAPRPESTDPLAVFLVWRDPDTIWMMGQRAKQQDIWALPLATGRPKLLVQSDDQRPGFYAAFASDGANFYVVLDERLSNVRWAELKTR